MHLHRSQRTSFRSFARALAVIGAFLILGPAGASSLAYAQGTRFSRDTRAEPVSGHEKLSRWRPGFQLGVNINNYSTTPDAHTSSRVGYIIGLLVEYRFSEVFAVQPEFRMTQKGFSGQGTVNGITGNYDARVNYLEIPLLLKAKFLGFQKVQPFAMLGPNVGFNVGNNVDVTQAGLPTTSNPPLTVLFKTVDFALDGALGLEYHFAEHMSGFASVRGSLGLVNVSDLAGTNWKSRGFQVVFGGIFDL